MLTIPLAWIIIGSPTLPPEPQPEDAILTQADLTCDSIRTFNDQGLFDPGPLAPTADLMAPGDVDVDVTGANLAELSGCALSYSGHTTAGRQWAVLVELPALSFTLNPGPNTREMSWLLPDTFDIILAESGTPIAIGPTHPAHSMLISELLSSVSMEGATLLP